MSWAWRKILHLRPLIRQFVWHSIGDGTRTSVGIDSLCQYKPVLLILFTSRDILVMGSIDKIEWKSRSGCIKPFAVNTVWHSIRPRDEKVVWADPIAFRVWSHMRKLVDLPLSSSSFDLILDSLIPLAKRRTSKALVTKLVIAASVYFIWRERNDRLFNNNKRTVAQVIECISSVVRLKLMSCRFKKSKISLELLER
ncbi:hypothetical protein Tco_0151036 [Tanacetum coccineum]